MNYVFDISKKSYFEFGIFFQNQIFFFCFLNIKSFFKKEIIFNKKKKMKNKINYIQNLNIEKIGTPPILSTLTHSIFFGIDNDWKFYTHYESKIKSLSVPLSESLFFCNGSNSIENLFIFFSF